MIHSSPAVLLRLACLLIACVSISCTTNETRYGKARFKLPPSYSRIHSPGYFTAVSGSEYDRQMVMVKRLGHDYDPAKLTPQQWDEMGDVALEALESHGDYKDGRELRRSRGHHSGAWTLDQAVVGGIKSLQVVPTEVVMSTRLYLLSNEAYLFALGESSGSYHRDSARLSRILETVRFE